MLMIGASLTFASLLALTSGQSAEDRKHFTAYQVQLAGIMATEARTASTSPAATSTALASAAAPGACILVAGSGNGSTTRDCTACHVGLEGRHSHPVDVDHESARFRSMRGSGPSLRPAAEVVKRGVFLADGKITCLTCHDGSSPWKAKLALPPDALLREPVKPGNPQTYDPDQMRPSTMKGLTAATGKQLLPAGTEVSPTPLCKACHSFD
jgi:hypothetical protein